ncbi:hypothetical protein QBC38DRAFT_275462 [Podospora fimiseda]|uniref:Uncharacterized protein n=1 Tax=Podospora fimiseda TaxID=252190 RepID=A0AAN7H7D0_9PEZI|nr:hypothetical protein QBC38DRAFT_275462 [Podospora fimiseda]
MTRYILYVYACTITEKKSQGGRAVIVLLAPTTTTTTIQFIKKPNKYTTKENEKFFGYPTETAYSFFFGSFVFRRCSLVSGERKKKQAAGMKGNHLCMYKQHNFFLYRT